MSFPEAPATDASDARRFVCSQTSLIRPQHVPEIALHLADEAHDLWLRTEAELGAIGLPPPFWAFAWAGGQGLARFVLDHPARVRGRRVLDFASGSGLVAVAAAMAGAREVTAADVDPFARAAAGLDAAVNGVAVTVRSVDLVGADLGGADLGGADLGGAGVECDLLLAGDVFYDRAFADRLVPWFDRLAGSGLEILVGDPGRAYLPRDRMEALAVYEVPVTRALEDAEMKRTTVWRWREPAAGRHAG